MSAIVTFFGALRLRWSAGLGDGGAEGARNGAPMRYNPPAGAGPEISRKETYLMANGARG